MYCISTTTLRYSRKMTTSAGTLLRLILNTEARRFQLILVIVFNDRTYPNFNQLFEQLSASKGNRLKWASAYTTPRLNSNTNGHSINSLFAQRSNIFKPQFGLFSIWTSSSSISCVKPSSKATNSRQMLPFGNFLRENQFSDFSVSTTSCQWARLSGRQA